MATYVLVHGAWHGAWCWEKVMPLLAAKGHTPLAVDLPAHGWDTRDAGQVTVGDYVESILAVIDPRPEPVILVGHSMGGLPITEVAERRPEKIAMLVYLSAYIPGDGRTLMELATKLLTPGEPLVSSTHRAAATAERFGRVRRAYIECLQDRAFDLAVQREQQANFPCERVISLNTSHSPFLSAPAELAAALASLA